MASKSNPNVPQKEAQEAQEPVLFLFPTSGPLAPVSGKKARKLQKAQNCARQRALEKAMKEGEVSMTDAPEGTEEAAANAENQGMEVDNIA
ncbi:hypothetical protein DID88_009875 [Monilinia fructigena]|uniref:Uncharacterized protein n=1 Tax=Monilinia fructigena TaxID=38457 RepID=A0A395IKG9_9HELO|nr:hypothetical protein DID88_009875 [Monilinia fructigena]